MAQTLFKDKAEVNDDWLFYIENEARALAQRDEFAIQNYIDREVFNPEVASYLLSKGASNLATVAGDVGAPFLNYVEGIKSGLLPNGLLPNFAKLKNKIKQIFCEVVRGIQDMDIKTIISAVLVALIPAFTGGLPAIALPIVIGLIASVLKYGLDKTCPA